MSIRERDADTDPTRWYWPDSDQSALDRRILLAALDALVEAVRTTSHVIAEDCWCFYVQEDRTKHEPDCVALRAAIAAAREASDG